MNALQQLHSRVRTAGQSELDARLTAALQDIVRSGDRFRDYPPGTMAREHRLSTLRVRLMRELFFVAVAIRDDEIAVGIMEEIAREMGIATRESVSARN